MKILNLLTWSREFTARIIVTPRTFQIRIQIISELQNIMKISVKKVDNEFIITGLIK
jgi:hypothetical protein